MLAAHPRRGFCIKYTPPGNGLATTSPTPMGWKPASSISAFMAHFLGEEEQKKWLKAGSPAHEVLVETVNDKSLLKRVLKVMGIKHTGLLILFEKLKIKVNSMREEMIICCLTLDEMTVTSKMEYDVGSETMFGNVTLPHHTGVANHALVFVLGRIMTRWKQTVAYYFIGNSTDGTMFKDIALEIIQRAADIGLHVEAVASDMGSANGTMWRSFSVIVGPLLSNR